MAEISLETAKDALEAAYANMADARREHEAAEAVLSSVEDDEEAVEELNDEGFDYNTAEAIVRGARHDYLSVSDVQGMTRAELRATQADERVSNRVKRLVEAQLSSRDRRNAELSAACG